MEENKRNILTLEFGGNVNLPIPYESRNTSDNTFVTWGINNLYPDFLINLYSDSSTHSAIINTKTTYIIGNGLKTASGNEIKLNVNAADDIIEFLGKVVKDYLLFNGFAVEVIFNVFGEPIEYHHIPFHRIRTNKSKTKFWYNDDWAMSRKYIIYDRYIPTKQYSDAKSKIFYFDGYFPSINTIYPTPEYNGTLKAILTDISIKEFNLNNIRNHFSPSTIITFFNGANVTEAVKKQIVDEIDSKFKGESGKKFIIDFQHKDGKAAEINQLSANDWDKAYVEVSNKNTDDILIGHQCINPSLFGIKTAGQLGSSQELEISYEILKNNYINVKRQEIQSAFNHLFKNFAQITENVEIVDKPLFEVNISDSLKEKIYTINELRDLAGLKPLQNGDRLLSEPAIAVQTPPTIEVEQEEEGSEFEESYNDYPQAASDNAKRAIKWKEEKGSDCGTQVGWTRARQLANRENISRDTIARMASFKRHQQNKDVPYDEGCGGIMWDAWGGTEGVEWAIRKLDQIEKKNEIRSKKLTEEDYERIAHLGSGFDEFEILEDLGFAGLEFDKESDIANYLIGKPIENKTLGDIVDELSGEGLDTDQEQLRKIIKKINDGGLASVRISDGRINITPSPTERPENNRVLTMYKYVKRAEASGDVLLPTSRDFCVRVIENNKLYTREDIQTMSSLFGYDVFKFAGGWWNNDGNIEKQCRHTWQQLRVKRK